MKHPNKTFIKESAYRTLCWGPLAGRMSLPLAKKISLQAKQAQTEIQASCGNTSICVTDKWIKTHVITMLQRTISSMVPENRERLHKPEIWVWRIDRNQFASTVQSNPQLQIPWTTHLLGRLEDEHTSQTWSAWLYKQRSERHTNTEP